MLIQVNLLPEEFRKKEGMKLALPDMPIQKALIAFFGVFFLLQVAVTSFAFYQKGRMAGVESELAKLRVSTRDVLKQKSETAAMRSRLNEIESLTGRDFYWTELLNSVSDSISKGVWLTYFEMTEIIDPADVGGNPRTARKIHILKLQGSVIGQGQETAYLGQFINEMKNNTRLAGLFDDIKLSNMNQRKMGKLDVYDFVLLCYFKRVKS